MRLVRAAFEKAGLETDRLEELKRRSDAHMREALATFRAAADERPRDVGRRLEIVRSLAQDEPR